ncbi:uncharacterized protein mslnb [Menidia menidia]
MKSCYLFLLVYLHGSFLGGSSAQRSNSTCPAGEECSMEPDATSRFMRCVGLPANDTGKEHMRRLKGMLEATMDVYSFMKSSTKGVPLLSLEGALEMRPQVNHLENEALIQMWLEVKIIPLLRSITKQFLSCLSTKNFSCSTYQTIVTELSRHYSEMNPVRQKWIYTFFMYPFLSGDRVSGCVNPEESHEEWLMKNFGAFRAMARMKDFSTLNMAFSGLEVLHLLSPAQKAELLSRPEVESLDNGTLTLVFHSLLTGGSGPPPTHSPGANWTSPGYPAYYPPAPSPQNSLREVINGFMTAFKPIGSFAHEFVSFTRERDVSQIRSTTLTQFLLNFTLAELADVYRPKNTTVPVTPQFDVTNVEDWYRQVVIPLLQRFLPSDTPLIHHQNITLAFRQLFFLDHGMGNESEIQDVCSVTLDKNSNCGLTNAVENMAHVLHCAATTKLTLNEKTIMRLIVELTERLNSLVKEFSKSNFQEVVSDFKEIFGEGHPSPDLTREHLQDPEFIKVWFRIKLLPLLPDVHPDLLSCLSTKNFSCPVFQTLVAALGEHMSVMDADPRHSHNIYENFVYPFLLQNNTSDLQCVSSANNSAEWLKKNFGFFSRFASITDFYKLNPSFSGLEALHLLSPKQLAEILLLPLRTPPQKDVVINRVFDFLMESPKVRKFPEVLHHLVQLAKETSPPCDVYKHIFYRLYGAVPSLSPVMEPVVWAGIDDLILIAPDECVPENITCPETKFNGTNICRGVDSSGLQSYMNMSMHIPCNFTLEEYACAQLENIKPNQLASLLRCDLPGNSSHSKVLWKMLLTKHSYVLDPALDILANTSVGMVGPSAQEILDVIGEIRVSLLTDEQLRNSGIINLWFSGRLRGLLPSASGRFLHCLSNRNLSCQSYQQIVQILSQVQPRMTLAKQMSVTTQFIKVHLNKNNTADPSCSSHTNNSGEWLLRNVGGFSVFMSIQELKELYSKFSPMEALPHLTVGQLAELSATPGQLTSADQVNLVMKYVPDQFFTSFFDDFSSAIMGHESTLPSPVRSAMLEVVFQRANLSDPSVQDAVVLVWLHNRLRPLLIDLSPRHVTPFFQMLAGRNCSTEQMGVETLNLTISSLTQETQKEVHNHIVQSLKGPSPLRCYGNNYSQSFYRFLKGSFMGFQFPNLTTFMSLMPQERMHPLINSMPPSDLGDFLRHSDVMDSDARLCELYNTYIQTPKFLETESLPEVVRRPTLPCVWPMALRSSNRTEVNIWFEKRLHNYLVFLTKTMISPNATHNASCVAFQKLVLVLGEHNFTAADFVRRDVYNTIRNYLTSAAAPRCYDPTHPDLNSTAWFAVYIGPFMPFLTLDDLLSFGSQQVLQVFTVNPLNIALLNHSALPLNLTNFYTQLIYQQDSNFNPLLLPLLCRCVAPGPAFIQLTMEESRIVLDNLTKVCTDLDPQISAALAGNFGENIDGLVIVALGNQSSSLSMGQIKMINPQVLFSHLSILGSVVGWNQAQSWSIIQALMSSGVMQINSLSSLVMLGSLIMGLPSTIFTNMIGTDLLTVSKNPAMMAHLMKAPQIVHHTFVSQIILVNSNSDMIIQNVPDELATEIPRFRLQSFTSSASIITTLNRKKWKQQQVELFFGDIATETATAHLGSSNNFSSNVLQGFTCTAVRTIKKVQVKRLIKACRRKGNRKVKLVETQLTCMYNYIRGDTDITSFSLYPPDVLLYYDYSLVPQASCRSYFEQLADADFSVFSTVLSYKRTALFNNARSCLGITTTNLTEDNISVLGNMCCMLEGTYIQNSDPSVLEKLKSCPDLTTDQASAVETLLTSGKTKYGAPSTWNDQTLRDLDMLPLYLTSSFYENFDKKTKRTFLRDFLKVLRRSNVERKKKRRMKREIRKSNRKRTKRSSVAECTVGTITAVTISDETFPFDYDDINQFNCCLSAKTVTDNLDAITEKLDEEEYLKIVLSKLQEAYNSTIPEDQVRLLGVASRVATVADINTWRITHIDTLAALMDSSDGEWDPSLAKAVITKYLSVEGNKLGSAELNTIGGPNLCSLDADVLRNITQQSLKEADALDVSNCTTDKQKELFSIANQAFTSVTRSTISVPSYQLLRTYIGGATLDYVRNLATSNVSMDLATFSSMAENVVLNLTVDEVKGLLGTNLPDLKSYENQTLVQNWISGQYQSQLDTLGLDLRGGRADPAVSTVSASNSTLNATTPSSGSSSQPAISSSSAPVTASVSTAGAGSGSSTMGAGSGSSTTGAGSGSSTTGAGSGSSTTGAGSGSSTTMATTKANGARIHPDAGLTFLVFLALLIVSQQIIM